MQIVRGWPVDADGGEIENGCSAAHDVTRNPRVTQQITQTPITTVYLQPHHSNIIGIIIIMSVYKG